MLRRVLVIGLSLLGMALIGAELYTPRLANDFVGREIQSLGITEFEMELTSKRPYLLRLIKNDLSGIIRVEGYKHEITFDKIEAQFTRFGLKPGHISFTGLVSEAELNNFVKDNWGQELNIVLTKEGYAFLAMPVNLYFITVDANIKGVFKVKDNNEIVYEIKSIGINVAGFERAVEQIVANRGFRLSLNNLPKVQINDIQVEEGFLIIYGIIK